MLPGIDTEVDPSPKKLAPTPSETTQTTRIAELCHQSYICKNVYQRNFGMLQKVGTHFSTIVSLNDDKVLEDYWNYRVSRLLNLEIVGITDQALWCHNPCLFLKVTWDSFRVLGRRHSSALSRVSPGSRRRTPRASGHGHYCAATICVGTPIIIQRWLWWSSPTSLPPRDPGWRRGFLASPPPTALLRQRDEGIHPTLPMDRGCLCGGFRWALHRWSLCTGRAIEAQSLGLHFWHSLIQLSSPPPRGALAGEAHLASFN